MVAVRIELTSLGHEPSDLPLIYATHQKVSTVFFMLQRHRKKQTARQLLFMQQWHIRKLYSCVPIHILIYV